MIHVHVPDTGEEIVQTFPCTQVGCWCKESPNLPGYPGRLVDAGEYFSTVDEPT